MTTMTAVRIHRFGGPEVLKAEPVSIPQPQDDEVLVRVHAVSVIRSTTRSAQDNIRRSRRAICPKRSGAICPERLKPAVLAPIRCGREIRSSHFLDRVGAAMRSMQWSEPPNWRRSQITWISCRRLRCRSPH